MNLYLYFNHQVGFVALDKVGFVRKVELLVVKVAALNSLELFFEVTILDQCSPLESDCKDRL